MFTQCSQNNCSSWVNSVCKVCYTVLNEGSEAQLPQLLRFFTSRDSIHFLKVSDTEDSCISFFQHFSKLEILR